MEPLEGDVAPPVEGPEEPVGAPSPATLMDAAIGFLVGILASTFLGAVVYTIVGEGSELAVTAASLVGLWIGLLWSAIRASRKRGTGSIRRDFGLSITWGDLWLGLLGGIGVQSIVAVMYLPFSEINSELSAPARELAEQAPDRAGLLALSALVVIGAPLVEEIFFRGVLMGALKRLGTAIAVLVSAVAFAFVHFGQLLAMPAFVVLGVVLALLVLGRKRLGPAIVTHATFNAITMAVLLFPSS
ncbi:MAG TPA: type II CAAX endopeptidase family protein [Acidimicrobiales bacterium]|nr:type II CAAX endopeptidase family protein [Acidimicrobiales bacterium]